MLPVSVSSEADSERYKYYLKDECLMKALQDLVMMLYNDNKERNHILTL